MRRTILVLAALLLAVVGFASDSSTYSLEVDVSPAAQPDFYMCRAVLTDLTTGSVVFAPSIQLKAGSPARASGGDGDLIAEFQVSVDSGSSRVTSEVRVSRSGKLIAAQKTSVAAR
jgi:hypothetical protein